ncbi:hypothetical protein AL486_15065 [Pandoraea apista]|uniref:DUF190 domain-containing protein n=1 Tax=Pandoraea apista TaxID=93218 RepID=UPI000CE98508|nr:DUF190 domain-containing protein [Pandoraea apista]AVF40879.1 hypothetical protein AL486_15065 [Pandoraea apista]
MDGCQLTFFLRQTQTVNHLPFVDWLLEQVRKRHIRGATVVSCSDGIDHLGKRHAARFFELADQPVEIVLAVTDEEADMLLSIVRESGAHVFYTRCPVQFESIGPV